MNDDRLTQASILSMEAMAASAAGHTTVAKVKHLAAGDILVRSAVEGIYGRPEAAIRKFLAATQYYLAGEYEKALLYARAIDRAQLDGAMIRQLDQFIHDNKTMTLSKESPLSNQNYTPNLGELVGDDGRRDAIHIAVAPVVAYEDLSPGEHIRLNTQGSAVSGRNGGRTPDTIGIVDPFLEEPVAPGQAFWLLLYPNTITGLRHVWSHPAFKPKIPERREP